MRGLSSEWEQVNIAKSIVIANLCCLWGWCFRLYNLRWCNVNDKFLMIAMKVIIFIFRAFSASPYMLPQRQTSPITEHIRYKPISSLANHNPCRYSTFPPSLSPASPEKRQLQAQLLTANRSSTRYDAICSPRHHWIPPGSDENQTGAWRHAGTLSQFSCKLNGRHEPNDPSLR